MAQKELEKIISETIKSSKTKKDLLYKKDLFLHNLGYISDLTTIPEILEDIEETYENIKSKSRKKWIYIALLPVKVYIAYELIKNIYPSALNYVEKAYDFIKDLLDKLF